MEKIVIDKEWLKTLTEKIYLSGWADKENLGDNRFQRMEQYLTTYIDAQLEHHAHPLTEVVKPLLEIAFDYGSGDVGFISGETIPHRKERCVSQTLENLRK